MLILDKDETSNLLHHLKLLRMYYQTHSRIFSGSRVSVSYQTMLDDVNDIIKRMEDESK